MPPLAREYLRHILDEIHYLLEHSRDLSQDQFFGDETLKRAFVRSLEIIGEAVKHLPDDMCSHYPEVEWRAMAGMRDRLIHAYFGIDYDIVWNVVSDKLPMLKSTVVRILESIGIDDNA